MEKLVHHSKMIERLTAMAKVAIVQQVPEYQVLRITEVLSEVANQKEPKITSGDFEN